MFEFEVRSDRQKEMLRAMGNVLRDLLSTSSGPPADLLGTVMGGELANYVDMLMAPGGGLLPVKTDVIRQYMVYGNENPADGPGIPKFISTSHPLKLGLTAMGLAAIASGKDGRKIAMSKYLPEVMKGKLFCYCITEPDAGTNTNKISTTAIRHADHFVMSGQKTFISAPDTAHFMVVVARIVHEGKDEGIGTFVMETATPGISMTPLDIAVLGDDQYTIYYDEVKLPLDALVGSKKGTSGATGSKISASVFYTLNLERLLVAFTALQICREALTKAIQKAREDDGSGSAPIDSPEIRQRLAKLRLRFEMSNLATKKATEAYDANLEPAQTGMFANMAKLISTEAAHDSADLALSLYGVEGFNKNAGNVGALFQMARAMRGIPINNESVINFLGENMLGLPKSYR
jgi:acyl-CoA dehydrogenase